MAMFKNEVGRPSNKTLRKRKIFYVSMVLLAIVVIGVGGFYAYRMFKPTKIETEEKDAKLLKFTVKAINERCVEIEAPKAIKNWRVRFDDQKNESPKYSEGVINLNHYNDGIRKQIVCTSYKGDRGKSKLLIKATTGANDKVYKGISPNIWKPAGWDYDKNSGWAYKVLNHAWPRKDKVLTITNMPSKKEYTTPTTLDFTLKVHESAKSIWWDMRYPIYYKVTVFDGKTGAETIKSQSKCTTINYGKSKKFNFKLDRDYHLTYAVVNVYEDSNCTNELTSEKIVTDKYILVRGW